VKVAEKKHSIRTINLYTHTIIVDDIFKVYIKQKNNLHLDQTGP